MNDLSYQIQPLSVETFDKLRKLIYEKTNIHMREGKQILVSNRLRRRVAALSMSSYEEYYQYLAGNRTDRAEMQHFIDAVSTNETYFYRETNHLDVMQRTILPELFARKRKVTIWSAGSSTGEEPYTLRILFLEGLGTLWKGELEIIATDINSEVTAAAREGRYRERSVRFVPADILSKYFHLDEEEYQVVPSLRTSIDFRVHNLLQEAPPVPQADIIFCRNVMIYFDKETQRRLTDDYFASVLSPGGYLCIGHSESLSGTSARFHVVRGLKAPVYQRVPEGVPS